MKKKFKNSKSIISQANLAKWNLDNRQECVCYEKTNNEDLLYLIEQFLKQIKNLLFLNLTKKIIEYYEKFADILKYRNLDLGKFSYVQKLFNFYKNNNDKYFFDLTKFYKVMDSVITPELCIHDYKIIVYFLESFKNVRYLEGFVYYIDEKHSNVAH